MADAEGSHVEGAAGDMEVDTLCSRQLRRECGGGPHRGRGASPTVSLGLLLAAPINGLGIGAALVDATKEWGSGLVLDHQSQNINRGRVP